MDFNNPRYYEEPVAKKQDKHMTNAIAFLEATSHFEYDETGVGESVSLESVYIEDAHRAIYMAMVEALTELKNVQATEYSTAEIDKLINKYKKKI